MTKRLKKFWNYFSTYEKIWFFCIMALSVAFAFIFPEENIGGVNGKLIMTLYLLDILFNISCELLISKQSKWNFLVSLLVEITEILVCVVCAYRFATIASTLFFWIPIDIISFINWNSNKDKKDKNLTVVRKLNGFQEVLIIVFIALWTIGVGYLITLIDAPNGILGDNVNLETWVCYLDACLSAVGICNGVFIYFRIREQWIAWYVYVVIESVINILAGQWVLLVLKAGYLTNTTYGFIKWTNYIKKQKEISKEPQNNKLQS